MTVSNNLNIGLTNVAIIYNVDGTLLPGHLLDHGAIQAIGLHPAEFWRLVDKRSGPEHDRTLAYMRQFLISAAQCGMAISKNFLNSIGPSIHYHPGIPGWFEQISAYGLTRDMRIRQFGLSTGLMELMESGPLAAGLDQLIASSYWYDKNDEAVWPARLVTADLKP